VLEWQQIVHLVALEQLLVMDSKIEIPEEQRVLNQCFVQRPIALVRGFFSQEFATTL
jgi:hypothetical protein